MFYMVFGSVKRPLLGGGSRLDWASEGPIGVYQADDPDEACKLAASDTNGMGTFFAIEGTPWGLELMTPNAAQFGKTPSAAEKLNQHLDAIASLDQKLAQLTQGKE